MQNQFTDTDKYKTKSSNDNLVVIGYTWGDGEQVSADAKDSFAKEAFDPSTGRTKYFIKVCISGVESQAVYNPFSPMFSGKSKYKYKSVSKEAFNEYLNFLATKKIMFARRAERLINA
jgi:hypothetical protein